MPQFNANKAYRIIKFTAPIGISFEIHQPVGNPTPGGPALNYEPVTTNPGNVKQVFPTYLAATNFINSKKIESEGGEIVFDSEAPTPGN